MDAVLAEFDTRGINSVNFRYCGLEFDQKEDYAVNIAAKDKVETFEAISYPKDRLLTRKLL